MHESDKQELRRVVLRVLQKDFHSLSAAQFENWTKQVLTKLDGLEQDMDQLNQRVTDLQQHLARLEGDANGSGALAGARTPPVRSKGDGDG